MTAVEIVGRAHKTQPPARTLHNCRSCRAAPLTSLVRLSGWILPSAARLCPRTVTMVVVTFELHIQFPGDGVGHCRPLDPRS